MVTPALPLVRPTRSTPRLVRRGLLLLLILALLQGTPASQNSDDLKDLPKPGRPVEHELGGGQTHSYRVSLISGSYFQVTVEQRGVDVTLAFFGPDGGQLIEVNDEKATRGSEGILFIARMAGNYRLEVRAPDKGAPAGRYVVLVKSLRPATAQDKMRMTASKSYAEAEALRSENTPESLRASITKFKEAQLLFRALADRRGEAAALNAIGDGHNYLGEKRSALANYAAAAKLWRAVGDRHSEAATLKGIGGFYADLGDKRNAVASYARALRLWRAERDVRGQATVLNDLGKIYFDRGDNLRALNHFTQALKLYGAAEDNSGVATSLNNVGSVYLAQGEARQALGLFEQALRLHIAEGDEGGQATSLGNKGGAYGALGELRTSLACYERALPLFKASHDYEGEGATLNNSGRMLHDLGETQQALDRLWEARDLYRSVEDPAGEAMTLHNIGGVHLDLGEPDRARDHFEQALTLWHGAGERPGEAAALAGLAGACDALDRKQEALKYARRALKLFRAVGHRNGEATMLNNIGGLLDDAGRPREALVFIRQARGIYRALGNAAGQATTLNYIGKIHQDLGERQEALSHYAQALSLWRTAADREGEAVTLSNLAFFERERGNLVKALAHTEEALDIVEALRTKIGSQELRASYFATVQDNYDFYIDTLMRLHRQQPDAGYDGRALQASERARARSLLELLREARVDVREGVDNALIERERSLRQELTAVAQAQTQLRRGGYSAAHATALAAKVEELLAEQRQVRAQIRRVSRSYAELSQPRPLTRQEIQAQALDGNTLLLEYSLGKERSYLWAITSTSITSYELPKRVEIEEAAKLFYGFLAAPAPADELDGRRPEMLETAARLSRMLLSPVAAQLGGKRLVIVPDGALQYLPFAALPDPVLLRPDAGDVQPLILRHEIVSLPSISVQAMLREATAGRGPAPKELAILADPVFSSNDERVKAALARSGVDRSSAPESEAPGGEENLERLPGTRKEALEIISLVSVDRRRLALDFDANRSLAQSGELSQYRHMLFATHGRLNARHPELSAIVLSLVDERGESQGGYLSLDAIYNLKLPADLVTLSGCETGLGKEVRGEGLIGLTRGFMYAGAARVAVTLWKVDDEVNAELVVRFYRGMLKEGKRPAEALRAAQIEMFNERRWQSPHYWAPLILQGEWR